jgi:plasmid stability protein
MITLTLKNIPDHLHQRLKAQAKRHKRSLNQEAILCLEQTLSRQVEASHPEVAASAEDTDRLAWLDHSASRLQELWDNDSDDVYNELLTK